MLLFVIISLLFSHLISALIVPRYTTPSKCRFSPLYSRDDILRNSTAFADDIFYWEGHFHQNNVGYNTANGMTYDGTLLNSTTGLASEKHPFSAASKEVCRSPKSSVHILTTGSFTDIVLFSLSKSWCMHMQSLETHALLASSLL